MNDVECSVLECHEQARWCIKDEKQAPYDFIVSCTAHVGELLEADCTNTVYHISMEYPINLEVDRKLDLVDGQPPVAGFEFTRSSIRPDCDVCALKGEQQDMFQAPCYDCIGIVPFSKSEGRSYFKHKEETK